MYSRGVQGARVGNGTGPGALSDRSGTPEPTEEQGRFGSDGILREGPVQLIQILIRQLQ